jgi:hypothetical protein
MNVSLAAVASDPGSTISGIQTAITLNTLVMATSIHPARQRHQLTRMPRQPSITHLRGTHTTIQGVFAVQFTHCE